MIRVGPAGWSYADWEGTVYPRKKPRGFHPLPFLARFVDCIELNSSFYATPRAEYAERWAAMVKEHPTFRFTAKLQDVFTHRRPFEPRGLTDDAGRFRHGLAPLAAAGRLAALLAQFPFSFRRTDAARRRIEWIRRTFGDAPLVLELRHRSWFDPEALDELIGWGVSVATIDLPYHADHPPAADGERGGGYGAREPMGPIGYLRLHGRNRGAWFRADAHRDQRYDYLYATDEVQKLANTARRLATGTDETYVITNNHFAGQAVANALELRGELEGEIPVAPAELRLAYPHLQRATRQEPGQGSLFD